MSFAYVVAGLPGRSHGRCRVGWWGGVSARWPGPGTRRSGDGGRSVYGAGGFVSGAGPAAVPAGRVRLAAFVNHRLSDCWPVFLCVGAAVVLGVPGGRTAGVVRMGGRWRSRWFVSAPGRRGPHSPHPVPARPPPCAAACCACPYDCGGTPAGRPFLQCRRRARSCANWVVSMARSRLERPSRSARSTRPRPGCLWSGVGRAVGWFCSFSPGVPGAPVADSRGTRGGAGWSGRVVAVVARPHSAVSVHRGRSASQPSAAMRCAVFVTEPPFFVSTSGTGCTASLAADGTAFDAPSKPARPAAPAADSRQGPAERWHSRGVSRCALAGARERAPGRDGRRRAVVSLPGVAQRSWAGGSSWPSRKRAGDRRGRVYGVEQEDSGDRGRPGGAGRARSCRPGRCRECPEHRCLLPGAASWAGRCGPAGRRLGVHARRGAGQAAGCAGRGPGPHRAVTPGSRPLQRRPLLPAGHVREGLAGRQRLHRTRAGPHRGPVGRYADLLHCPGRQVVQRLRRPGPSPVPASWTSTTSSLSRTPGSPAPAHEPGQAPVHNDMARLHLLAGSAASNRSTGDKAPGERMPSRLAYHCTPAEAWVHVKPLANSPSPRPRRTGSPAS